MKRVFLCLLIISGYCIANAQNKNNVFVDVAINSRGLSATYDRKISRHFELGGGLNLYNFSDMRYTNVRSAFYLDLRPYWSIKRSLLFSFLDIGMAINGGRKPDSATISPGGLYVTLGAGYCYRINKRGMGPYVTLGMYGYSEHYHYQKVNIPPDARNYSVFDATLLISLGFKI